MLNKKNLISFVALINIIIFICSASSVWAQEDEAATFNSLAPDALIIMDLSGSMDSSPAGDSYSYGSSTSCVADTTNCTGHGNHGYGGDPHCSGGFCDDNYTGCNVDCSKLAIAKRALFSILDDNNDNTIDSNDSTSLNIRIGFMRYYNCGGDISVPTWGSGTTGSGCAQLVRGLGSKYSQIYCNNTTSCASTVTGCSPSGECIVGEQANGGTPLASTLKLAKNYLDYNKSQDNAKACRLKFVILMTDGADTYACSGNGGDCQADMYQGRRETIAATKQLADAGYKVFVVGFGSGMPLYLQNTLNWMAYYGGTNNPLANNVGNLTAYNIPLGCNANPAVPTACCNLSSNATACYPSGPPAVTSCQTDTSTFTDPTNTSDPYYDTECTGTGKFYATNNDPGHTPLSGYAFLAGDADQLTEALKTAFTTIRDATYSFTQISVQTVRTKYEDFLYAASFQPLNYDPFWIGHLQRFSIDTSGNVNTVADWDAGDVLSAQSARTVLTYKGGSLIPFNSSLTPADLGVTTTTARDMIVSYILNGESSADVTNWKLGDIFHSSPLSIATPNPLFFDRWDKSIPTAFETYRNGHERTSSNGKRIIIVGDNDGQLHAFKMGEAGAGGGSELWSFVPPNLLSQLRYTAHNTHPTTLIHKYFVDGPSSAAEIWLGTPGPIDTKAKSDSDWHTYLAMSEGRGGSATLWSSSPYCDSGFNPLYSPNASDPTKNYVNYCGYYVFDISETSSNPVFKYRLGGNSGLSAAYGAYLGQAWSQMFMGRVLINNTEKWVGLIGGGFSGVNCGSGTCDTRGKGFYVVDLNDGTILWRYTDGNMKFDLAAGPVAVDYDSDGFLDTAYIGDTGGNVWRFKFCLKSDGTSCNTSNWSGGLLFCSPSTSLSIYTSAAVTVDPSNNLWVYFGTGDKTDPTSINTTQEKIYAIKDDDRNRTTCYNIGDLTTRDSTGKCPAGHGWFLNLGSGGEKILAEPLIFQQSVYFTTFTPPDPNNPCNQSGDAKLYILDYLTCAGKLPGNASSENIGTGIPNAPVISRNPYGGTDLYVGPTKRPDPTFWPYPPNSLLYWRDTRVQ